MLHTNKKLINMNAEIFFYTVAQMRKKQKDYYRCPRADTKRKTELLKASKDAEKIIDEEIKRVMELKFNPEIKFD